MWRLCFLILIFAGFTGNGLFSQGQGRSNYSDKPLRIEIPARSVNETYRIIPCGTNGVIMFFRSQEMEDESHTNWYFTCYDTNMQQVWVKSVPLFNEQAYRFQQISGDTVSLLFIHGGKSKGIENNFEILRIVPQNGTLILNKGTTEDGVSIDAFGVQNSRAWLGLNRKGQAGRILTFALDQGRTSSFSLGIGSQISVLWMQPDTSEATVSAIVSRQVSKKNMEYYFVRYDTNGLIRREVLIGTPNTESMLTQVRVASLNSGPELVLGSYRQGVQSSTQKNRSNEESTGLLAGTISSGSLNSLKYYNFLELQSINSIVGEDDIANLKKKALKKQKSIGEYSLDLAVLMHEILIINGQYILSAELYSPQYHTENFTDYDFYGRPYTNSYSVFDGYRFFSAIVAGFGTDGKLLWDNNIEIRNLVSSELAPKVVIYPDNNDLVLCYVSDGKIGSKIIQENNVVEKLDFAAIDMLYPEDKLLSETKGTLVHWYGNYFLSYGYQDVKNIALDTNNKRLVFYFTKLSFER